LKLGDALLDNFLILFVVYVHKIVNRGSSRSLRMLYYLLLTGRIIELGEL